MRITTVLFDLDGTLLPMDQEKFVKAYLGLLAKKLAPYGYDPKQLVDGIWAGTGAMVKNAGEKSNEAVFWDTFEALMGKDARKDEPIFEAFYRNEFAGAQAACGFNSKAAETVHTLKDIGLRVALATNPIFPAIATQNRIRWAGLQPEDFELVTAYENSRHSKPNPAYYRDIVEALGVKAEECLMVGNDANEDLVAATVGMKVFLLTDCLIVRDNKDLSPYPQGSFDELMDYIKTL